MNTSITEDFLPLIGDVEGGSGSIGIPKWKLVTLEVYYDVMYRVGAPTTGMSFPNILLMCGLIDVKGSEQPDGSMTVNLINVPNYWLASATEERWRLWRVHSLGAEVPATGIQNAVVHYAQLFNAPHPFKFKWRGRRKGSLDGLRQYCFHAAVANNDFFAANSGMNGNSIDITVTAKWLIQS